MRSVVTIVLLTTFVTLLSACSSQSTTPPTTQPCEGLPVAKTALKFDNQPLTTPTATLLVHGLSCPQCSSNVDKQLMAVQGVQQVQVNLGTGQVAVRLNESHPPTSNQLAAAIKKTAYTLVRIDPSGEIPVSRSDLIPKTATA